MPIHTKAEQAKNKRMNAARSPKKPIIVKPQTTIKKKK